MKKKFSTALPKPGQRIDLYAPRASRPMLRNVEFVSTEKMTGAVRFEANSILYVTPSQTWTQAKE